MNEVIKNAEEKMKKAIAALQRELATVRTGRANPGLLDRLSIEYYGAEQPIKAVANISVPDGRTLLIQPYERSAVSLIEKAIQKSDLGLTPNSDGSVIRLSLPMMTEDRRKELVKVLKKSAEEGKVAIRNVRRDEMDALKKLEKAGDLTEDERKRGEEKIQKLTDRYTKEVEDVLAAKEKEVMEV